MQNLHLKNLQNLNIINIYLNKIEKIYNNNYDFEKLITLLKKLYSHIEKELESIKIKNSKIQLYRAHLLDYIWDIQEYELRYPAENAYSIVNHRLLTEIFQNHIEKLKQLKDIDINSQWININHEYQYDTDEGRVLIVFDTQNHLTALHRELMILVNNNIIKDISTNDY